MVNNLNIKILIDVEKKFVPKAEYVFRTICYVLNINPFFYYKKTLKSVDIYYGADSSKKYPLRIKYNPEADAFFQKRVEYPQFKVRFNNYKNEKIPFFFSGPGEIFHLGEDSAVINKDIISSAFYLLSCWQEYIHSDNDNPDVRFDYKKSMQYRWDFTDVPVVDAYCDIIDNILEMIKPEYKQNKIWNNKKDFCVTLSHDIDYWNIWTKEHLSEIIDYNRKRLSSNPVRSSYKLIAHYITKQNHNPEKAMQKILKTEQKHGVRSTSFLLVDDDSDDIRRSYFKEKKVQAQLKKAFISEDVGLHGSPKSAYEIGKTAAELRSMDKLFPQPKGFRSHKLSFEYHKTCNILSKMNFKYDSSLGFWEHIGFRAGISFPFFPFNIEENRPFTILEIPLVVMDTSMLSKKGMDMSAFSSSLKLVKLFERAQKFQSHISILWHNNSYDTVDYPFWTTLYSHIIKSAKKRNATIMSLDELHEFWTHKNSRG